MLRQLFSSGDNVQSMVIYPEGMNHASLLSLSSDNGQSMVIYP